MAAALKDRYAAREDPAADASIVPHVLKVCGGFVSFRASVMHAIAVMDQCTVSKCEKSRV